MLLALAHGVLIDTDTLNGANEHPVARCKKQYVEQKLSEIVEANGLPWVSKLVSITSSRQGGTKILYCVVHV
jgi:hypothetical protein